MTIDRELVNGVWLYADPRVGSAAIAFLLYGFDLADFDNLLEEPGWDSRKAGTNRAQLLKKRELALDAYFRGHQAEWLAWINFLQAAKQSIRRLASIGVQEKAKRDRRKIINRENATAPREGARVHDHEEIRKEFRRLIRGGHTEREARGMLTSRGDLGSRSTIARATARKNSAH